MKGVHCVLDRKCVEMFRELMMIEKRIDGLLHSSLIIITF